MGILEAILAGLMVYTAYRSYHLVTSTLPADAHIIGYFGLLALDVALIAWVRAFRTSARGEKQKEIANWMIWIQIIALLFVLLADTVTVVDPTAYREIVQLVTIFVVPVIVVVNIGAAIRFGNADPKLAIQSARVDFEDTLEGQMVKNMKMRAPGMAARVAPSLTQASLQSSLSHLENKYGVAGLSVDDDDDDIPASPIHRASGQRSGSSGGMAFPAPPPGATPSMTPRVAPRPVARSSPRPATTYPRSTPMPVPPVSTGGSEQQGKPGVMGRLSGLFSRRKTLDRPEQADKYDEPRNTENIESIENDERLAALEDMVKGLVDLMARNGQNGQNEQGGAPLGPASHATPDFDPVAHRNGASESLGK